MKKFKIFIDNIFIYGFGSIIGKVIPLIMLPIITRIMPDSSYYGLNDLSTTLISVGQAIAVFGMYDAMFRLFFDRDNKKYQQQICSTALLVTLITSIIVSIFVLGFHQIITIMIFNDIKYTYLVYMAAFSILIGSTNNIVAAPTKIQNQSKIFIIVNTVSPIIAYLIAIPLLLFGHYSIALQLSNLIASIIIEFFFIYRNKKWFSFQNINLSYIKPLLEIAAPLMPSFLIYWIYNSADRLMIQHLLGTKAVGLYAIGSKLGQMSNLIYTAFTGGWLYFAYSTMKEEKQVENNSRIFEYLGIISFSVSILICSFSYVIYKIIFTDEYLMGFKVAPYLFLAPLLQMLFQIAGNQFIIIKKSWPNVLILSTGAVANVVLNFLLIPKIGIEGAAIGTLMGYLFADIICIIILIKIHKMIIYKRFFITAILTIAYFILWGSALYSMVALGIIIAFFLISIFFWLYKADIKRFLLMIKGNEEKR